MIKITALFVLLLSFGWINAQDPASIEKNWEQINHEIQIYIKGLNYGDATALLEKLALETKESKDTLRYICSLSYLLSFKIQTGEFSKALQIAIEGKDLTGARIGKYNTVYLNFLDLLIELHFQNGQMNKAIKNLQELKEILGPADRRNFTTFHQVQVRLILAYYSNDQVREAAVGLEELDDFFEKKKIRKRDQRNLEYVRMLNQVANLYILLEKKLDRAQAILMQERHLINKRYKKDTVLRANNLYSLINLHTSQKEHEKAREYMRELADYIDGLIGHDTVKFAQHFLQLGEFLLKMENYIGATKTYEQVYERLKLLDNKDLNSEVYQWIAVRLYQLYMETQHYKKAYDIYQEIESFSPNNYHPDSTEYLESLLELADLQYQAGSLDDALQSYLEIEQLVKRGAGNKDSDLGGMIYKIIGNILATKKEHKKAEDYFHKAIEFFEDSGQQGTSVHISTLIDIGNFYNEFEDYQKALSFYIQAESQILNYVNKEGKYSDQLIKIITAEAMIHFKLGNIDKAFGLAKRSIALRLENKGIKSSGTVEFKAYDPELIMILQFYAAQAAFEGQYQEAVEFYLLLGEIIEEKFGRSDPQYLFSLVALAEIYNILGQHEVTLKLFRRIKTLKKEVQSENPVINAYVYDFFAAIFEDNMELDSALHYYWESTKTKVEYFGSEHQSYLDALYGLAKFHEKIDSSSLCIEEMLQLSKLQKNRLHKAIHLFNERDQTSFLYSVKKGLDYLQSLAFREPHQSVLVGECYDNELFFKGLILNSKKDFYQTMHNTNNPNLILDYDNWLEIRESLSQEYGLSLDKRSTSFDSLENEALRLEKNLMNGSATFKEVRNIYTWDSVRQGLNEGEAAIEFSQFNYHSTRADSMIIDSIMYVAYIIKKSSETPMMIPLFEEKEIRTSIIPSNGVIDESYSSRGKQPRLASSENPTELYKLVWEPIDSFLDGIHTIYFAASGLLNRINLPAISIDSTRHLFDKYEFHHLTSTKEVIFRKKAKNYTNRNALLVGDVDYSESKKWQDLSGAREEIYTVAKLLIGNQFDTTLLVRDKATESLTKEALREKPSPFLIHIPVHGKFSRNPDLATDFYEGSMHGSGIVLAEAIEEPNKSIKEDGILNAHEFSQFDLTNTKLVVLSACETGLGEIGPTEGVYGLQRALKIAGVQYIIMSLWNVPDEATLDLMRTFYRGWATGKSIPVAFRDAQKKMSKKGKAPSEWAGFVLIE